MTKKQDRLHPIVVYARPYNAPLWVINHKMRTEDILVLSLTDEFQTQYPEQILIADDKTVYMSYTDCFKGQAVVFKRSPIMKWETHEFENATQVVIKHKQNTKKNIVQCWNDSNEMIFPDQITKPDRQTVILDFNPDCPVTGKVNLAKGSFINQRPDFEGDCWEMRHWNDQHFSALTLFCIIDDQNRHIIPYHEVRIDDLPGVTDNKFKLQFSQDVTGQPIAIVRGRLI